MTYPLTDMMQMAPNLLVKQSESVIYCIDVQPFGCTADGFLTGGMFMNIRQRNMLSESL